MCTISLVRLKAQDRWPGCCVRVKPWSFRYKAEIYYLNESAPLLADVGDTADAALFNLASRLGALS